MTRFLGKALSLVVLLASVVLINGCGGGEESTPAQKTQLGKLSKTWNIVSADLDGDPRTAAFTGFKITISGTFDKSNPDGPYDYTVAGSMQEPSPWPGSGEWSFSTIDKGADSGTIVRSDAVPMDYMIDSTGKLTLKFTCVDCDYDGARIGTVQGLWTFVMN